MEHSFKFIYIIGIVIAVAIVVTLGIFVMKNSLEFVNTAELSRNRN